MSDELPLFSILLAGWPELVETVGGGIAHISHFDWGHLEYPNLILLFERLLLLVSG